MKNVMLLVIVALCAFYYWETHRQQEAPPAPVAAVAPKPTPRKIYYHSPLDAPALPTGTGAHSGTGYASRNRNTNWRGSHLSDGAGPRTARPDDTPDPEADDSGPTH